VVVGLGHDGHRDLAVGPEVVRRLRQRRLDGVLLVEADQEPGTVLDRWGADHVVVVAAVSPGYLQPGRLHTFVVDAPRPVPSPDGGPAATFGAHTLLAGLQRMPPRLTLFTVDAGDVSAGVGFTAPVARVLDDLVDRVAREVSVPPAG
jgi:hydrogenase maturation protease